MAEGVLRVDIRRKTYDGAAPVLAEVAFSLAPGERLAVLGPSGIGKSTLLNIVAGLDDAYEGSVSGAGRIGMAFQEPTLLPWRSVLDNLMIATGCTPAAARDVLATVRLEGMAARYPGTLSFGQARRVSVARAFLADPDTLLLDEPFASLDESTSATVRAALADLLRDRPTRMVLVTHDRTGLSALVDRTIELEAPTERYPL